MDTLRVHSGIPLAHVASQPPGKCMPLVRSSRAVASSPDHHTGVHAASRGAHRFSSHVLRGCGQRCGCLDNAGGGGQPAAGPGRVLGCLHGAQDLRLALGRAQRERLQGHLGQVLVVLNRALRQPCAGTQVSALLPGRLVLQRGISAPLGVALSIRASRSISARRCSTAAPDSPARAPESAQLPWHIKAVGHGHAAGAGPASLPCSGACSAQRQRFQGHLGQALAVCSRARGRPCAGTRVQGDGTRRGLLVCHQA